MKRTLFLLLTFLFVLLPLSSCASLGPKKLSANQVRAMVQENYDLFFLCCQEMEKFGEERIYVARETEEITEENGETVKRTRLVSYTTQSGTRTEIQSEILEETLIEFGFALIFYQTGSDARRSVIFSYTKENASGIQNGFYYSYDAQPCAWWGRTAELIQKADRYMQLNKNESAWYYTVAIENGFFYFEKKGALLA